MNFFFFLVVWFYVRMFVFESVDFLWNVGYIEMVFKGVCLNFYRLMVEIRSGFNFFLYRKWGFNRGILG